jgi:hypothetical protein
MSIACVKPIAAGAILLLSLSLGSCASSNKSLMDARAEVPTPAAASNYPSVNDLPPAREARTMTNDERVKLKNALTAARDHQAAVVKARDGDAN